MKHAAEVTPSLWQAYTDALERAKACFLEADAASAVKEALNTPEGKQALRAKVEAAKAAFDEWRQTAADLYEGAGLPSS